MDYKVNDISKLNVLLFKCHNTYIYNIKSCGMITNATNLHQRQMT